MYHGFEEDGSFVDREQVTDAVGSIDWLDDVNNGSKEDNTLMLMTTADDCWGLLTRREYKAFEMTTTNNFLQQIVFSAPKKNVSLVYSKSMLSPSIYWHSDHEGNITSALPSGMLAKKSHLSENGSASIEDHIKSKTMNPSLLTSMDPWNLMYSFDSMANFALRTNDSWIILNQGFALQGNGAVESTSNDALIFDTNMVDNRPIINMLSAVGWEEPHTLFGTWSANQKDNSGLKEIK